MQSENYSKPEATPRAAVINKNNMDLAEQLICSTKAVHRDRASPPVAAQGQCHSLAEGLALGTKTPLRAL